MVWLFAVPPRSAASGLTCRQEQEARIQDEPARHRISCFIEDELPVAHQRHYTSPSDEEESAQSDMSDSWKQIREHEQRVALDTQVHDRGRDARDDDGQRSRDVEEGTRAYVGEDDDKKTKKTKKKKKKKKQEDIQSLQPQQVIERTENVPTKE
eukprot:764456-Hanusia_phi.AAC.4